jgi:hypothetical protein
VIPDAYQKWIPFQTFKSFNRFAPFKTFKAGASVKDSMSDSFKVRARSAPLHALGVRGQETLRSLRARLHRDIQPHSSLVKDTGPSVIAESMHLIAGRTAQEYNERKNRHGPLWEDRYHATAIKANEHLHRRDWWPLRLPLRISQTSRRSSLNFQLRRPYQDPGQRYPKGDDSPRAGA